MTSPRCTECGGFLVGVQLSHQRRNDLCASCDYWRCFVDGVSSSREHEPVDPAAVVVINGQHFYIEPEPGRDYLGFRGFGGSRFVVRFADGRVVETRNLWQQGVIPAHFRDRLKDNAVAIEGMHT